MTNDTTTTISVKSLHKQALKWNPYYHQKPNLQYTYHIKLKRQNLKQKNTHRTGNIIRTHTWLSSVI